MVRKIVFLSGMILVLLSVAFGVGRPFAQASLTDFEVVDNYISTRMKELDIPITVPSRN